MKAFISFTTTSSHSRHLASKIRKGRWTAWEAKIRARDKLYKEIARLNLGGPSDDRESTYAVMIGEMPKQQEEEEDLYSLLNGCIDFGEAAGTPVPTRNLPSKNDAVSVLFPSAPVSESVDLDHKITASVVPPSSSGRRVI